MPYTEQLASNNGLLARNKIQTNFIPKSLASYLMWRCRNWLMILHNFNYPLVSHVVIFAVKELRVWNGKQMIIIVLGIMNYENISLFLKPLAGQDDKL